MHASLSLTPPIRPDGRSPTQFRPLVAETGILPGTNGSARICFADGTEAIVGVKAEVERTRSMASTEDEMAHRLEGDFVEGLGGSGSGKLGENEEDGLEGQGEWVELTVEIPGYRDDDSGTVFLSALLTEALLADGGLVRKLRINRRFHWKLYLDVGFSFLSLSNTSHYHITLLTRHYRFSSSHHPSHIPFPSYP